MIAHLARHSGVPEWEDPLSSGEAVVVLTGQQPALLGGPLYTLYKTLTAIEAARRIRESGYSAIAAFWCVGDDTDHNEVGAASWPVRIGPPKRVRDEVPANGVRIGRLEVARMRNCRGDIGVDWPASEEALAALDEILLHSAEAGWSGFLKETLLRFAAPESLLFVDGNDPAVTSASQPWLRRFAAERRRLAREIGSLADSFMREGREAPLLGEEALRSLFLLDGERRNVLDADRDPPQRALLLPNVVLRPALQEHLLPVARVACGEAEIAYRSMLGPVYARAGTEAAPLMRRFAATLFPPAWNAREGLPDPGLVLDDPVGALDRWAWEAVDPSLYKAVCVLRDDARDRLERLRTPLGQLDPSLEQALDSVKGKIDYQMGRLEEALHAKARLLLRRRHPGLADLREFLLPRGKPQERSFTLWTPLLWEGLPALRSIKDFVGAWFDRGEQGHALIALGDGESGS